MKGFFKKPLASCLCSLGSIFVALSTSQCAKKIMQKEKFSCP